MTVRSYADLEVWQKAIRLAVETYRIAARFPPEERFGMTPQSCRAGVSIGANIAEGHERRGAREFLKYVSIARGSLAELETYFELAERLAYATIDELRPARSLAADVSRMLSRLRQALSARGPSRPAPRAPSRRPRPSQPS